LNSAAVEFVKCFDVSGSIDREFERWSAAFAGQEYFYGHDPGPLARRAVRYHKPLRRRGSTSSALDIGCGEGQDSAFLAGCGYAVTGVDFVENALEKAHRLLELKNLSASFKQADLSTWKAPHLFDLVLACNSIQFLGENASSLLESVIAATAPGGVLGLSLFGCEDGEEVQGTLFFTSLQSLLTRFDHEGANRKWQMLETTRLWQWNTTANAPQPFVTVIAQRLR
jgi:tellurite methyltransferase